MGGIPMRIERVLLLMLLIFAFSFTLVSAKNHTPEERGKAHFDNPAFAGGQKSCSTCHPNGRGLGEAGAKTAFSIMGGQQNSLEETVNACIVNANKGNAINNESVEMQELVSYINSLGTQK